MVPCWNWLCRVTSRDLLATLSGKRPTFATNFDFDFVRRCVHQNAKKPFENATLHVTAALRIVSNCLARNAPDMCATSFRLRQIQSFWIFFCLSRNRHCKTYYYVWDFLNIYYFRSSQFFMPARIKKFTKRVTSRT